MLRSTEKVDVVICLSHGGVEKDKDGRYTDGDDVRLAKAVPGIDIVIGGHSHTELHEADHRQWPHARRANRKILREPRRAGHHPGRRQADGRVLPTSPDRRHHCRRPGHRRRDRRFKKTVTEVVFASRGYSIDQPLAVAPRDMPNTFIDIAASTILANLCTDAFRERHESGHRVHRQRHDALRSYPREVRRANRLRRLRRGAPRRRCCRFDGRQRAGDRLISPARS